MVLYGPGISDARDIWRSTIIMLLTSVGHVRPELFTNSSITTKVYIFIYVLLVLFYLSMIYFGIFLESYRVSSLRKGYSYYQKQKYEEKKIEKKLKEKAKAKEEKEKEEKAKKDIELALLVEKK